jgi:hypothetical protein
MNLQSILNAVKSTSAPAVAARGAAGAGLGGYVGYEGSPKAFGYEDVPEARNMSALLDALTYGGLAAAAPGIGSFLSTKGPMAGAGIAAALGAEQMLPVMMAGKKRDLDVARKQLENAATSQRLQETTTNALNALGSPTAKGVGAGVAGASLLALLTGLTRKQTAGEIENRRSRTSMVGHDLLKYLIPGAIGGGVIGSLRG